MRPHIEERVIDIAKYVIKNKATVRKAAKNFGISKSTVHTDLRYRLPKLNKNLYSQVDKILDFNLSERHIRGGEAIRRKYREERRIG